MKTDIIKRRLRFAPPQPSAKRIAIRPPDIELFAAIRRHGPLSTPQLHAFVREWNKNLNAFQAKLTKFYNGTADDPPLVSRPGQQFDSFSARYQHVVHDLTKESIEILKEHDRYGRLPERTDPFVHRLMNACVSASIELACREAGIRFISTEEILSRETCPEKTRTAKNPLLIPIGAKGLIPDNLFGFQYPDKSYRFFALEVDRNTESVDRRNLTQTAFGRKLEDYLDIMSNRTFREHWGIPNLVVLTVTTNATHLQNFLTHLDKMTDSKLKERFLFAVKPEFGRRWRVPTGIMSDLLTDPWKRTKEPFAIDKP